MNTPTLSAAAQMAALPAARRKRQPDPQPRFDDQPAVLENGLITGPGTGTSDSIPLAASRGEVIVPAEDVSAFGAAQILAMVKKGGEGLPKPKVLNGRVHAAVGGLIEDPGAVTRVGNSYSGGNVSGPINVNGQAPGGTVSSVDPFTAPVDLTKTGQFGASAAAPASPAAAALSTLPTIPAPQPMGGLSVFGSSRAPTTAAERFAAPPVGSPIGGARPAASTAMGALPGNVTWSSRRPSPTSDLASAISSLSSRLGAPASGAGTAAPAPRPAAPADYASRNDAFNAGANAGNAAARQPRLGFAEGGHVGEEELRRLAQAQAQNTAGDVIGRRPPINMGPADVVPPQQLPRPAGAGALQPVGVAQSPAARTVLAEVPAGMGQRPSVNMGMVDLVQPARLEAPAGAPGAPAAPTPARPSMGARIAGVAGPAAALAGIAGAAQSVDDISSGRRDQFQRDMGVATPLGAVGADAARVLANVGDAATFGLAGRTGRGVASALGGGSFVDGFAGPATSTGGASAPAHPAAQPLTSPRPIEARATLAALPAGLGVQGAGQPARPASGGATAGMGTTSSAERIAQFQRDGQHLQDLAAIQRRADAANGPTPGLAVMDGAGADAERRARFNEQANLNNARAQGSWSPRHGYQGNDAGVAAALSQIKTRADGDVAAQQERGQNARARMTDVRQQQALQVDQQRLGLEGQRLTLDANRDDRASAAAATDQSARARLAQLQEQVVSGTPEQRATAAQAIAALSGREVTGNQPPAGYRRTADGNLEAIKGGPADPAVRGSRAPLNDTQSKALQFGTRMQTAGELLDTLAAAGTDMPGVLKRSADAVGLGGAANWTQSPEQQQVEQAQRDFINAVLRRESGAAIAESEFTNARSQYFPQIGDSPEAIAQKRNNRLIATRGILAEVPDAEARVAQVRGKAPAVGTVDGGWTFTGGDPADRSSWRKGQ